MKRSRTRKIAQLFVAFLLGTVIILTPALDVLGSTGIIVRPIGRLICSSDVIFLPPPSPIYIDVSDAKVMGISMQLRVCITSDPFYLIVRSPQGLESRVRVNPPVLPNPSPRPSYFPITLSTTVFNGHDTYGNWYVSIRRAQRVGGSGTSLVLGGLFTMSYTM